MTPERRREWIRLWVLLAVLLGGAALVSPWLALLLAVVLFGGWAVLWVMVAVGFDAVAWVLGKFVDIGEGALEAAMAPQKATLGGIYAELAQHEYLMKACYPRRYADVEREAHERRAVFDPEIGPFDYEGTLARYREWHEELIRSAEPFIERLHDGNRRHRWCDARELRAEEEKIRELRRQLLRERGQRGTPVSQRVT